MIGSSAAIEGSRGAAATIAGLSCAVFFAALDALSVFLQGQASLSQKCERSALLSSDLQGWTY
jgi:hypothetical protein